MKAKSIFLTVILCLFLWATGNAFETIIPNDSGHSSDNFGSAVAISGDYVIIGAMHDDDGDKTNSGAAYLYKRESNTWVKKQKLLASDAASNDYFGCAVAIDGDIAFIGAYNKGSGAAYLFENNNDTWTQKEKLTGGDSNAQFGWSVSISEETVIVGAPYDDSNNYGAAYIFVKGVNGWSKQQKIKYSQQPNQRFAWSVSISRNIAVIGEPYYYYNTSNKYYYSRIHSFLRENGSWSRKGEIAQAYKPNSYFGYSVSISGQNVIVGQYNSNLAYIYSIDPQGEMTQVKQLKPPSGSIQFGYSVSISENYAIVGANYDDDKFSNEGSAYIYYFKDNDWFFHSKIAASNNAQSDQFGSAVAISNDSVIVGAPNKDGKGSSYVYSLSDIPSHTISGYVMDSSNKPCPDTILELDANDIYVKNTTTDQNGYFSIIVNHGYTGHITPQHDFFKFRPLNREYTFITKDYPNQYFFLDAFTISGKVTDPEGIPIPGVEIIFSDNVGGISSIFTNSQGYYSYQLYSNFSGTAFPVGMGNKYIPIRIPYENLQENMLDQNYTGYRFTISGHCKDDQGNPLADVTIAFSPGNMQTQTDKNGFYSQDVPYLWNGTVSLEKVGVDFTNQTKAFHFVEQNFFETNFVGQEKKYQISGIIQDQNKQGLSGVNVCFSGIERCEQTDNTGYYQKIMPFWDDFNVTVAKNGYLISPENRVYTQLSADYLQQNYTATIIRHVISGHIFDKDNNCPLSNAMVHFGDSNVTTDSLGRFNWETTNGTTVHIVPEKTGYHFIPKTIPVNAINADMPDLVFTAEKDRFTISGRVLDSKSQPLSGVTVKLTHKEIVSTDTEGNYAFQVEYGYAGKVEVFFENYFPSPTFRNVPFVQTNQELTEFTLSESSSLESILVYPDLYQLPYESGQFSFTVQYSPQNLDWRVASESTWIAVTRTNSSVLVRYTENLSENKRHGLIFVKKLGAANHPEEIQLIQAGKPADIVGPEWSRIFDPNQFQYQQIITAIVKDDMGQLLDQDQDMLAAFCGDELRGVAHPIESSQGKRFYLQVYSNHPEGDDICFKFYDSTKDCINVNIKYPVTFLSDAIFGNIQVPHEFAISDYFVRIALEKNWNWITINVENDDMSVSSILKSLGDQGIKIVGIEGFSGFDIIHQSWEGSLLELSPLRMYQIFTNNPVVLEYSGNALDIPNTEINLNNGWNWLGYIPATEMSIDHALAKIKGNAIMIVGQKGYAFPTENDGWIGSLSTLEPNRGYKIKMALPDTLIYPETPPAMPRTRSLRSRSLEVRSDWDVETGKYQYQTTITAQVFLNNATIGETGDALIASVDGETRGFAIPKETSYGPMYFLQIWGETGENVQLKFFHSYDNRIYDLDLSFSFVPDASDGTVNNPKQIHLDDNCHNLPDWNVDTNAFEHQGMITAIVKSGNENISKACDVLGAFVNNHCRGVAQGQNTEQGVRFFLSVWGNETQEMTFKYFQASDENTYTIDTPFMFTALMSKGSLSSPYELTINGDWESKYQECEYNYSECNIDLSACINSYGDCEKEKKYLEELVFAGEQKINELTIELAKFKGFSIDLPEGWSLISGVNATVTPRTEPSDCISVIYKFENGGYVKVDSLSPMYGYWIKLKQACKLIIEAE
jgi:hypothetical protein